MSDSPAVLLYDANGKALAVADGVVTPAATPGVHAMVFDGTTSRYLRSDSAGRLVSSPAVGTFATYSASVSALAIAASATDIFTITGSASKIVRVLLMSLTATRTSSGGEIIFLARRSTANSGGTSTTPTPINHDSTSSAATAVVRAYTANPTVGTFVGNIRAERTFIPAAVFIGDASGGHGLFGGRQGAQSVVLRGVNEVLAINLDGVSINGGSFHINVEWTEE